MATTVSTGFRVDALLHSLKELQNEKNCLEQKLNEQREKRRELEKSLNSVNAKYLQVSDINTKMVETLKVAQHKEAQAQSMANSLEETNTSQREQIDVLNNKIENEKANQFQEIQTFENQLSQITEELKICREFYSEIHLEGEISDVQKKKTEFGEKIEDMNTKVEEITIKMEKLLQHRSEIENNDDGVPLNVRQDIWDALMNEKKSYEQYLKEVRNTIEELKRSQDEGNEKL
ncbi:hypothetical protein ScPMuIL_017817 [Solemya velum]